MDRENAQTTGWTIFGVVAAVAAAVMVHSCSEMVNRSNEMDLKTKQACMTAGGSVVVGNGNQVMCIGASEKK